MGASAPPRTRGRGIDPPGPPTTAPDRRLVAAGALLCLAVGGLSLLIPSSLNSDAWSWLVWGREVRHLALDTTGGSSWKPLPVLFTPVVSLFGDGAPALWLVLIRASWVAAVILAYRLGSRLGGRLAGVIGAAALLVIPNLRAQWLNYFLTGGSEPLIAALVLGAIDRHLAGRRLQAMGLGCLAALGRPEAWVLLVVYALLTWRAEPHRQALIVALVAIVPVLWLGGGLWGSGSLLSAGIRARQALESDVPAAGRAPLRALAVALDQAAVLVTLPLWLGAAGAVACTIPAGRRRSDPTAAAILWLGAGAVTWIGVVVITALLGLPALSRFMFAPAAVICVLAGVGVAQLVGSVRQPALHMALASGLIALTIGLAVPRLRALAPWLRNAKHQGRSTLAGVLEQSGAKHLLAPCGNRVTVLNAITTPSREVAWRLGLPLSAVRPVPKRAAAGAVRGIVVVRWRRVASRAPSQGWRRLARSGKWSIYAAGCGGAPAAASSGAGAQAMTDRLAGETP